VNDANLQPSNFFLKQ